MSGSGSQPALAVAVLAHELRRVGAGVRRRVQRPRAARLRRRRRQHRWYHFVFYLLRYFVDARWKISH